MPRFRIKCAETATEVEAPTLTAALRLARVRPEAVTQVQIVVKKAAMKKPKAKHKRPGAPRIRQMPPEPKIKRTRARRQTIHDPMSANMAASMAAAMGLAAAAKR